MSNSKKGLRGWLLIIAAAVLISLAWNLFSVDKQATVLRSEHSEHKSDDEYNNSNISDEPGISETDTEDSHDKRDSSDNGQEQQNWPVYIVGAVNKPGIYKIDDKTCLYELIELAGGMTENAAADRINLAAKINSNQLIRIPTIEEWQENPGDYVIKQQTDELSQSHDNNNKNININQASKSELESLPGVGPATAQAIIDYRTEQGPYANIEEIMQVPGIKENRFAQISDLIET